MKIERTSTYIRFYIGSWYITKTKRNKNKSYKSEKVLIYLINNQHKLTSKDLQESINYLIACQELINQRNDQPIK